MSNLTFVIISLLIKYANVQCPNETPKSAKYHLTEKCYKSTLSVVFRANFTSVTSCSKLAFEKKGLSFNFSPPEAVGLVKEGDGPVNYTCEILRCAEAEGGLSMVNDSRYDHYSLYAKHLPNVNSSCVPGIGMFFLILTKQNHTLASEECKNMSGSLADVLNEKRTDALAQLIEGVGAAFVGVQSDNGSDFQNVYGDKLDCTTYRAWAPGHPRRNLQKYGCVCVAVTKLRTWLSLPCKTKMPAICELNPSGPYKRGSFFASKHNNNITDENKNSY